MVALHRHERHAGAQCVLVRPRGRRHRDGGGYGHGWAASACHAPSLPHSWCVAVLPCFLVVC